jgi:uncharacterized protein
VTAVDVVVGDAPDRSRYEAVVGDRVAGFSVYIRDEDTFVFTHTEVDPAFEGEGVGGTLVRGALDDVRRRGGRVVAHCPFVHAFIERHPEYQDLLAD